MNALAIGPMPLRQWGRGIANDF